MKLKLIDQDKANHAVYGAAASALCASVALLLGAPLVAAGGLGVGAAGLLGWAKEQLDKRANAQAIERGDEPPHSVEAADIKATAIGGLLAGVPLMVAELAAVAWRAVG